MLSAILAIIKKEFRQRSRVWSTLGTIFIYTSIMGFALYLTLVATLPVVERTLDISRIGQVMLGVLFSVQLLITLMISVGYSSTTFTSEKEQATFELVNLTLLSNQEIVLGKFLFAVLMNLMLILTALPFYSIAFIFGGIEPRSVVYLSLTMLGVTLSITALGILLSLTAQENRTSVTRTMVAVVALLVATFPPGSAMYEYVFANVGQTPHPISYLLGFFSLLINPYFSMRAVLSGNLSPTLSLPTYDIYNLITNLVPLPVSSFLFHLLIAWVLVGIAANLYPRYRSPQMVFTGA